MRPTFLGLRLRLAALPAVSRALGVREVACSAAEPPPAQLIRRKKRRLDEVCLELRPEHSRNVIQSWIVQGKVLVNGRPVTKAGTPVGDPAAVTITAEQPKYVCRAGLKLEAALQHWGIDVCGKAALDSGLSTGGFTDCLLQHGAARVVGVDVGYGQVAERVRTDPRVAVMERTNLRQLRLGDIGGQQVDLVTLDLSFISSTKMLDTVCDVLRPGGELLLLIKPQFEAGKEQVSAGGVVRDPAVHQQVIDRVVAAWEGAGFQCQGWRESPIKGANAGNTEFLSYFRRLGGDAAAGGGGAAAAAAAAAEGSASAAAAGGEAGGAAASQAPPTRTMRLFVAFLLLGLCAPAIAWGPAIDMKCARTCAGGVVTDRWHPVCADDGRGHGLGTIYPNPCVWKDCVDCRGDWEHVTPVEKADACLKVWKGPNPEPFTKAACACPLSGHWPEPIHKCRDGRNGCERCRTKDKCAKCFFGWRTNGNSPPPLCNGAGAAVCRRPTAPYADPAECPCYGLRDYRGAEQGRGAVGGGAVA
ncbi:hemolysin A isoform B [Micractinium conductrix]|uniref:Hemolysin A isoform B n=1 Tax=Micractinium conductrix TaxID=554055 RepID=A0A2P6V023_9CHLO|nr:hemolysin A isoform B [Micractinium conductrix]|eukprot:PSC67440.1 hemolysin A isoform B [Micractinium conductrix]